MSIPHTLTLLSCPRFPGLHVSYSPPTLKPPGGAPHLRFLPRSSSAHNASAMTATEWIAGDGYTDMNRLHRRVCFSFAAYSKAVIDHLKLCGIPIDDGLSDAEFSAIETAHGFQFPPELHSILREGLPVGAGFPNWRFASPQQLQNLLSLPTSGLLYEISRIPASGRRFWPPAWGPRPDSHDDSISLARSLLTGAPKLIPVYRHFYITATSNIAGNPLFYVCGGDVRCCGFDLADFFCRKQLSFLPLLGVPAPSWAATVAKRVEVWTDLASGYEAEGLDSWMKGLGRRLRKGGWGEKEVREMLLIGESDNGGVTTRDERKMVMDRPDLLYRVQILALALLRGGWSAEDVIYSMGGSGGDADSPPETRQVGISKNEISFDFN